MRVVVVVCPRFPPSNAADSHRVRLSVKHYESFGWRPLVLCSIEPPSRADDWSLFNDVAASVEVVRVKPWPASLCKLFGFNIIELRAFFPLLFAGLKLIYKKRANCAFFSTTAFAIFLLGPIWKILTGVRVVYDIQDPWFHGAEVPYTSENAPGSWRKYKLMQSIARYGEPFAMKNADQIMAVSEGYIKTLVKRYSLEQTKFTLLPFPGAIEDFDLARHRQHNIFKQTDGGIHWVYAGRAGPDLAETIKAFLIAVRMVMERRPACLMPLTIYFVGTNYAPDDRSFNVVESIALDVGMKAYVREHSRRIPYLEVLNLYASADLVLLLGSNEASYTASKLINCVLSRRPLLAIVHQDSTASKVLSNFPEVYRCCYLNEASAVVNDIVRAIESIMDNPIITPTENVTPWLARENARIQCEIFEKAIV